tara:strand:- start:1159 stop:2214 length:1056 start_codon:yes stop_codon:yes gene_type:complete
MITIPDYRGIRAVVPGTYDPKRRPGSGGQRYFTDVEYVRGPQLDRLVAGAEPYDAAGQAAYETRYNTAMDTLVSGANTRAANQQTALAAANTANPAQGGLSSLQRVTDSVLATDIGDIQASDVTDRQKIDQTIGYMNEQAVSPYRLSQVTGTPLSNVYDTMNPYYRTEAEQKAQAAASPHAGIKAALATAGTDLQTRPYQNFLRNIPVDGAYSTEEMGSVTDLLNSGNITIEQIATYFNKPVEEVRQYYREQGNRQGFNRGGLASIGARGMYLGGSTDGMADKVPASIDNNEPARLSDGEFVVPADVVSHLGNGNSDAGAKQLYGMMDKVRKARTGTTQQGRQINPNNFLA